MEQEDDDGVRFIGWNVESIEGPFEATYYNEKLQKTVFQFKSGAGIAEGTKISVRLQEYYGDNEGAPVASGEGKVGEGGCFTPDLKSIDGTSFVPEHGATKGTYRSLTIANPSEDGQRTLSFVGMNVSLTGALTIKGIKLRSVNKKTGEAVGWTLKKGQNQLEAIESELEKCTVK
ncbi:MAG: hypothetical protein IJT16_05205 [Lachnospiraceae bacterium]|nr:hypothetical protein [Lachnospiraceae bacterium]